MNFEGTRIKSETTLIKIILICILIASGALVLRNVGHSGITYWDEGFHAVVARNLTKHPLKFTLYDQPWLPYDYKGWGENHIWLHKPPVGDVDNLDLAPDFGINTFALRLPSAISLVGNSMVDVSDRKRISLINGQDLLLRSFKDSIRSCSRLFTVIAIRITLILRCYSGYRSRVGSCSVQFGLESGRNYILSGVAMGVAYLSKSYLACITFGIALVVWGVARGKQIYFNRRTSDDNVQSETIDAKIRLSDVGLLLLAGIATVAPWVTYCLIYYRKEFLWEHKRVLDHLNTDVESWGASWDRPLFDYMPLFYPVFYAALFARCVMSVSRYVQTLGIGRALCVSVGYRGHCPAYACRNKNAISNNDRCATVIDLFGSRYQSGMATTRLGLYIYVECWDACDHNHLWRTNFGQGARPVRWP